MTSVPERNDVTVKSSFNDVVEVEEEEVVQPNEQGLLEGRQKVDDSSKMSLKQQRRKNKNKKNKKNKKNGDNNNTTKLPRPLDIDVTTYADPPLVVDSVPIVDYDIQDFVVVPASSTAQKKKKDTVIVTKIHGLPGLQTLRQMLCLLHYAYNSRTKHDIVVFTSEPIIFDDDDKDEDNGSNDSDDGGKNNNNNNNDNNTIKSSKKTETINKNKKELQQLQSLFAEDGVTLRIVVDNPGLHTMVHTLPIERRRQLLQRCGNLTTVEGLSWYSTCTEQRSAATLNERLAYTWQAEFRALHLWNHVAIRQYDYMMWIDADAFCTRRWTSDPVAVLKRYNLTLLFDHFPQGSARGYEFPSLTRQVFNKTICDVELNSSSGTLFAKEGNCLGKKGTRIHQVHGFLHVTKLDFFRSQKVSEWNSAMIRYDEKNAASEGKGRVGDDGDGDDDNDHGYYRFSRLFDDQIGLTIPAAVLAGNSSRDMRSMGVKLRVMHNYVLDGFMADWRGYFVPWWRRNANTSFPEACDRCVVDISG